MPEKNKEIGHIKCGFESWLEKKSKMVRLPITPIHDGGNDPFAPAQIIGGSFRWGSFPEHTYVAGEATLIGGFTIHTDEVEVRKALEASANQVLHPGKRYEIRKELPMNFGKTHGMVWISVAWMDEINPWESPEEPLYVADIGVYLIARLKVE